MQLGLLHYLARLDKSRIIIYHASAFEDHQLLGEIEGSDRSHFGLEAPPEVFLGCLLVSHGDAVGYDPNVSFHVSHEPIMIASYLTREPSISQARQYFGS